MTTAIQKTRLFALATTFLIAVPNMAQASPPTPVPTSTQPAIVLHSLDEKKTEPKRTQDNITVRQQQLDTKNVSHEKAFTLKEVLLDGSTVYSQAEVDAMTKDYVGKTVSFADLNEIANRITKQYREAGYMLSRAVVPPQKINGGIVHLRAVEGRITDVKLLGDFKDANGQIAGLAEKIKTGGPANTKDIERYLLLINDLPGVKAQSLVQPSKVPEGGEVIITVEQKMFEGSVEGDNRGSTYLGPYRGTLVGAFNNLLGTHDRTTFRGIESSDTQELRFFDVTHEEDVGTEGLRLKARAAFTNTLPGRELKDINVQGESRLYDFEGQYPVIRSRQLNFNLFAGVTAVDTDSELAGFNTATDRVRYARGGTRFDFTDALAGVSQVELQVAQGINGLDATDEGAGRTRVNGKQDFTRENFTATRIQDLWPAISMEVSATGQYSADPLLASEEFALGGPDFGRAYDAGEITGDSGIAGMAELRYSGNANYGILETYQLYTYYDLGKVWNKDSVFGELPQASLASAGIGTRFNLKYDLTGYVELDQPLTRRVSAERTDSPRVFFSLLKRF